MHKYYKRAQSESTKYNENMHIKCLIYLHNLLMKKERKIKRELFARIVLAKHTQTKQSKNPIHSVLS